MKQIQKLRQFCGVILLLLILAIPGCGTSNRSNNESGDDTGSGITERRQSQAAQGAKVPASTVVPALAGDPRLTPRTAHYSVRTQPDKRSSGASGIGQADFQNQRFLVRMEEVVPGLNKVVYEAAISADRMFQRLEAPQAVDWREQPFDPAQTTLLVPDLTLADEESWPSGAAGFPARRTTVSALIKEVRQLDGEILRSVETDRYRINLDRSASSKKLTRQLASTVRWGPDQLDIWLDKESRIRKLTTNQGVQYERWDLDSFEELVFPDGVKNLMAR